MTLSGPEDVHIAPQGYETERVSKPAIEYDADRVVLLVHDEDTEKGIDCLDTVTELLEAEKIPVEQKTCDFFDLNRTLWTFAETVQTYSEENLFVNLSTGSKITAIGGMIACMATGATPYYVMADGYHGETIAEGAGKAVSLNAYPIGLPDEQYLEVLRYLENQGQIAKGQVVEFVQEEEFPLLSKYDRQEIKNLYGPVNKEILAPLEERGFTEEQRRGQEKQVWITEEGEQMLELFSYLLD